jgi:pSer/pThr/pTyr-binding forkhead associated (FHA) protein
LLGSLDEVALYLVAIDGPEAGRSIELGAQTMSIGRDPHLDIVLTGNKVSRLHALATVIDLAVVVEDLESLNGTFIDGERVSRERHFTPAVCCGSAITR